MNKRVPLEKGKLYIQLLKLICCAQFQLSCFDFFFYSTRVALRDAVHRKKGTPVSEIIRLFARINQKTEMKLLRSMSIHTLSAWALSQVTAQRTNSHEHCQVTLHPKLSQTVEMSHWA